MVYGDELAFNLGSWDSGRASVGDRESLFVASNVSNSNNASEYPTGSKEDDRCLRACMGEASRARLSVSFATVHKRIAVPQTIQGIAREPDGPGMLMVCNTRRDSQRWMDSGSATEDRGSSWTAEHRIRA